MATELKYDIQDLKSRMVALETLSATIHHKVPVREEEGRAKGHGMDNNLQGAEGGVLPPLTLGKGEYKPLKTAPFTEIPESSNARGCSAYHHSPYEPRDYKLPKVDFPKFDGEHPHVWK
jgi:hypothetical protein